MSQRKIAERRKIQNMEKRNGPSKMSLLVLD
jgi:hypothetical protein